MITHFTSGVFDAIVHHRGTTGKTKTGARQLTWFACLSVFLVLASVSLFAQFSPYSPTNPNVTGSDFADRIAKGELIFMPYHGNTMWDNDQIFTAYSQVKVPSYKYNFAIGKDQSLLQLTNITDHDFMVFGNYYSQVDLGSDYLFSFDGDPLNPIDSVKFHTMALFNDYAGIPAGRFPVRCTVTDLGEVPMIGTGSVTDESAVLDYNLYIIDLEEQTRTIETAEEKPVAISLKCIPADLPESYVLRMSVSWNTSSSNLYTDPDCDPASLITGDYSNTEKRWAYSLTPPKLYYSRPENDTSTEVVTIKLYAVGDHTDQIISATLTLAPVGSFTVTSVMGGSVYDDDSASELKGFWDKTVSVPKESAVYPSVEWKNDIAPYDGIATDAPDMYFVTDTQREYNRPFVYNKSDNYKTHYFEIQGGTIRHTDNVTYTNADYKLTATASNGKMIDAEADSIADANGVITFGAITGSILDKICAENVVIHWKLVNRNTNEETVVGDTQHFVYVTGGPTLSGDYAPYHTEVDISTKGAAGKTGVTRIAKGVLHEFDSKSMKRIDGAGPLQYWGDATRKDEPNHMTVDELLKTGDGDCNAWAALTREMLGIQGVSSSTCVISLEKDNQNHYRLYNGWPVIGFLQKEHQVQGINYLDLLIDDNGDNEDDRVWFENHVLVTYYDSDNNLRYFDPGISKDSFDSVAEYVREEIKFVLLLYNADNGVYTFDTVDASLIPNVGDYYYVED